MGALKYKDTTGAWVTIPTTGPPGGQGPIGPTGPQGDPGIGLDEVFVGPDDPLLTTPSADVWIDLSTPDPPSSDLSLYPRGLVATSQIASMVTNATVNVMIDCVNIDDVLMYGDRMYQITASHRAIQDLGVGGNIQMQVAVGTVNLQGYDVVACTDPNSLWGAWSQTWIHDGALLGAAPAGTLLRCRSRIQCSIASRTVYTPRLHIVDVGQKV